MKDRMVFARSSVKPCRFLRSIPERQFLSVTAHCLLFPMWCKSRSFVTWPI